MTIFIGYSSRDEQKSNIIAQALKEQGWQVKRYIDTPGGVRFREYLEAELAKAACVVILWSNASVDSEWVQLEAEIARERDVLVPVVIDDVDQKLVPFSRVRQIIVLDSQDFAVPGQFGYSRGCSRIYSTIQRLIGRPEGDAMSVKHEQEKIQNYENHPFCVAVSQWLDRSLVERKQQFGQSGKLDVFDFQGGWGTLFEKFFSGEFSGEKGALRDFSISSHANLKLRGYNFVDYPGLVHPYAVRHMGRGYSFRFMMLCDFSDVGVASWEVAERFIGRFLEINHPFERNAIKAWQEGIATGGSPIEVMITNQTIVDGVVGEDTEANCSYAFNVYGDHVLSRSIVGLDERGSPRELQAHLTIYLEDSIVASYKRMFDTIWKRSGSFRAKAIASLEPDKKIYKLGDGTVFSRWREVFNG